MNETPRSPEEIAELNKSRIISDADALKHGAKINAEGNITFTEQQIDEAKVLMASDKAREKNLQEDAEIKAHGLEWIRECSEDGGASLDALLDTINDLATTGRWAVINNRNNRDLEAHLGLYRDSGRYDIRALNIDIGDAISRYNRAHLKYYNNIDIEKLRANHPIMFKGDGLQDVLRAHYPQSVPTFSEYTNEYTKRFLKKKFRGTE